MPRDDTLWKRLETARTAELHKLADIVGLPNAPRLTDSKLVEELSKAIRSAAGHSFRNLVRNDHDFPYKQILIDVADKLAPGWTPLSWTKYKLNDHHDEIEIEETIWQFYEGRVRKQIANIPEQDKADLRKKMEEDLRKAGYRDAVIAVLGFGLMAVFFGLLGVGPSLLYYLGNTNYRKMVPAALQLIYIRKLRELEASLG